MKIEGSGSIGLRHGSADPDPHQNVMDPEHFFVCLGFFCVFVLRSPCLLKCVQVSYAAEWFQFRIIRILKVATVFGTRSSTDD